MKKKYLVKPTLSHLFIYLPIHPSIKPTNHPPFNKCTCAWSCAKSWAQSDK